MTATISELLHGHECVIIPGFGAFIANPVGAEINMASRQGLPPRKVLSFNEALQLSDGLLINHLARNQHLSYEQAKLQIEETVKSYKAQIAANGFLTLEGLGRLVRNPEGQLEFNEEGHNFQLKAFGLPTLDFYPIIRSENQDEKKALITKHLKQQTLVKRSESPKQWLPVAAVAAMLLLVLTIGVIQWAIDPTGTSNNQETASISQPITDKPSKENLPQPEDLKKKETVSNQKELEFQDADRPIESPEKEEKRKETSANPHSEFDAMEPYPVKTTPSDKTLIEEETPEDKSYWVRKKIVVGAFGVEENARRLSKKIKADGYATEVRKIGALFHVRILVHSAPTEVPIILQEVQEQFNASARIL
ncbi:MAG: SPOR domain-containing protein [Bacteroidota bacterium]